MLQNLTWVDYIIIGVIGLSVMIGLGRGLLKEAISLTAWILAFLVAIFFAADVAEYLKQKEYIDLAPARAVLAFGGLFLITLIIGGLVNVIVGHLVEYTGLAGTDRLLGAVFGLLRGAGLIAMLVLLVDLTHLDQETWWTQSQLLPPFQILADGLRDMLPTALIDNFKFEFPKTQGSPQVTVPTAFEVQYVWNHWHRSP